MNVLDKIEKLRLDRGWSVYRLAEKAGITDKCIYNWYNRNTMPSIEVTRKDDGKKILLNVSGIDGVFPEAKGAFVSMRGSVALFCPKISGYFVEETYWEVKEQIMRE